MHQLDGANFIRGEQSGKDPRARMSNGTVERRTTTRGLSREKPHRAFVILERLS